MRVSLIGALTLLVAHASAASDPSLRSALKNSLGFSDAEIARLEREPLVREIDEGGSRAVTIAAVTQIAAPVDVVLAELRRPELLLDAAYATQIGSFSQPPVPADVASYQIPASDLDSLRSCSVGDCKVKLQAFRIEDFQALDWKAAGATARAQGLARRAILEYATGYQERGASALALYADKAPAQSLAEGFEKLMGRASYVRRYLPELDRHLREFPAGQGEPYQDAFFWAVSDFGYRPTTELIHAVVYRPGPRSAVIALKHIFATHYFHARLEFVGLSPDPERPDETVVIHLDRSLFDDDLGRMKRALLVRRLLDSKRKRLESLREQIEQRATRAVPASAP